MQEKKETIIRLINEVKAIALAKGIAIDPDITPKTIAKLKLLPYETTSSMHRDYLNHKPHTEMESLTGYVVRIGKEMNIETPEFSRAYECLNSRKH